MAVTAEALTFDSTDTSVCVAVTREAVRSRIAVPRSLFPRPKSFGVGSCVGSFDTVCIHMACDARWIGTFRIVTGSAGFHITPGKKGVRATSGADPESDKSRLLMCAWFEVRLIDIPTGHMARGAELLLAVACLAVRCLPLGRNPVGEFEIQVVHLQNRFPLPPVDSREARGVGRH